MTHYDDALLVLDKGYVRLISSSGDETDIVNAARASFDRSVDELGEKDISLLEFLVREKHMSPFRHVSMTFEVYAPLMVARQHWKYVVGSSFTSGQQAWNESCLPEWQELWGYGRDKPTVLNLIDGMKVPLQSVNSAGRIVPNVVKNVWPSGKQHVLRIAIERGYSVSATKNHRILTPDGYVEAGMLKIGDMVAYHKLPLGHHEEAWLWSDLPQYHNIEYSPITLIEQIGECETYDIEMELEPNFVAGGIVVHNSRRYITEEPEFYAPDFWRSAPESRKQGSGRPIEGNLGEHYDGLLDSLTKASMAFYNAALDDNIAPEMARLFLPAYGLYVRYRWTVSVDGLINFFDQRIADDAQWEIQQYAQAFYEYASERFPNVFDGR